MALEAALLDPAERALVQARCTQVAAMSAIPLLVHLCAGPDGPLPDMAAAAPVIEVASTGKKKGKKAKKGKKPKLEPGARRVEPGGRMAAQHLM